MTSETPEASNSKPDTAKKRMTPGCALGLAGLGCGFSPLIYAFLIVYTVCGGDGTVSQCGGAAAVFLLPFTLIIGAIMGVIGLILHFTDSSKKSPVQSEVTTANGAETFALQTNPNANSRKSLILLAVSAPLMFFNGLGFFAYIPGMVYAIIAKRAKESASTAALVVAVILLIPYGWWFYFTNFVYSNL